MLGSIIFFIFILVTLMLFYQKRIYTLVFMLFLLFDANINFLFPDQLFGLINYLEFLEILVLMLLMRSKYQLNVGSNFKKHKKVFLWYLIISLAFNIFSFYKYSFVLASEDDINTIIRRTLKFIILIYFFVEYLKRSSNKRFFDVVENVFVYFGIFYGFSTLIYYPLLNVGIDISFSKVALGRNYGVFASGDSNVLSATFGIVFGYFLANIEKGRVKKKFIISMIFIFIGIIETGSRGGFLGLILMIPFFVFNNYNKKIIRKILPYVFLAMIVFVLFGSKLIMRTLMKTEEFEAKRSYDQTKYYGANIRIFKWIVYYEDLKDNPDYFIAGINQERSKWIQFQSHNMFIQLIYYGGLLFFIPYILNFIQIVRLRPPPNPGSYSLKYAIIPYFIMLMELNEWFYFMFALMIIHSAGYIPSNEQRINGD